jgi:hypothetical protein
MNPGNQKIEDFYSLANDLVRPISRVQSEQLRQAKVAFDAALTIGGIGTLILLAGVLAFLFGWTGNTTASAIATSTGIVSNLISFFMIKFLRTTNTKLDEIRRDENAFHLINQIQDTNKKDDAIIEYVKSLRKTSRF